MTEEQKIRLKAIRDKEIEENKERVNAYKKELIKLLVVEHKIPRPTGGQQCGMPVHPISVKSEELGIEIIVKAYKSNYKNRDLGLLLMELAMDDIVK